MDINLNNNEFPLIGRWVVKYDDVYNMPQFLQGRAVGDSPNFKNGQAIVVGNIESIDLRDKILKTNDGFKFKLVGAGKRMILIDENAFLELGIKEMKEQSGEEEDED